jgi:PAT family beta-lactamase induction signal transducer AmpG
MGRIGLVHHMPLRRPGCAWVALLACLQCRTANAPAPVTSNTVPVREPRLPWLSRLERWRRFAVVTVLGFASGLPLALTGQALQAWLTLDGMDIATIGFLSLVGLPYTFKFLWAPLLDRFELPGLSRRRGWMVLTQIACAALLAALSYTSPKSSALLFALLALAVAFASASQDVVIDAYRTDLLPAPERGLGSSLNVMGYRLAMILSGGVAFIWVDPVQGGGWSWPEIYRLMAWLMVGAAVFCAVLLPRLPEVPAPRSEARHDLWGFVAVLLAVALGVAFTQMVVSPALRAALSPLWTALSLQPKLSSAWTDLLVLLIGLACTLPMASYAARRVRFETLLNGLGSYFSMPGAWAFLALIVLYKLTDAFALSLLTPFLLSGMHFGTAEVGVANKVFGLWITIGGALLGGLLMLRLGLWRALFAFGLLQGLSNLGFWWLAHAGAGSLGAVMVPAFDWGVVSLRQATAVDGGLLLAVALDNLSGGMGTAAFLALLMGLCNQRFTATQFALLSAFASIGRVWVGPLAGVVALSVGWPSFFVLAALLCLPALVLLLRMRPEVERLDVPAAPASAD